MKQLLYLFFGLVYFSNSFGQSNPTDRVRLKGSPRQILTWDWTNTSPKAGKMDSGDSVFAMVNNGILTVKHKRNGMMITLFESMPDQPLLSTFLGLYEFNFDDNPLDELDNEKELVLINSPSANVSMVKVFHMTEQPPVGIGSMWGNSNIELKNDKLVFTIETVTQGYRYTNKSFVPE